MKTTATVELTPDREISVDRSNRSERPGSMDDWSNWFRRSEPPALTTRGGQNREMVEEVTPEWVVPMLPKPRRVAAVAKKAVRAGVVRPRRHERRRVVDSLRSKCQRLRTFDDWSNWFWKGGSSEVVALA
ncbi:MAG: hypothetical protein J0M24_14995 [Verrucomicrobia bacterium]|nr:hypothetical protein [Verrucomicrobiota bacterium]